MELSGDALVKAEDSSIHSDPTNTALNLPGSSNSSSMDVSPSVKENPTLAEPANSSDSLDAPPSSQPPKSQSLTSSADLGSTKTSSIASTDNNEASSDSASIRNSTSGSSASGSESSSENEMEDEEKPEKTQTNTSAQSNKGQKGTSPTQIKSEPSNTTPIVPTLPLALLTGAAAQSSSASSSSSSINDNAAISSSSNSSAGSHILSPQSSLPSDGTQRTSPASNSKRPTVPPLVFPLSSHFEDRPTLQAVQAQRLSHHSIEPFLSPTTSLPNSANLTAVSWDHDTDPTHNNGSGYVENYFKFNFFIFLFLNFLTLFMALVCLKYI